MPALEIAIEPPVRAKHKILIVEDEALVAADLEERLNNLGYEVCGLTDTCEGAVFEARSLRPDLVLMDIHLIGEKDGIEAASLIRKANNIPVIFLTAHADDVTLNRIGLAEPFGYALKPFDERELKASIEVALSRQQAESRLKKMERWLATTLASIGDGVIATELEGNIKFINPVAQDLVGWPGYEALGRNVAEVFIFEKEGSLVPPHGWLDHAFQQGIPIRFDEGHFLKSRDGKKLPVSGSVSAIRDDHNTNTGWVIVFRDVSALLEAKNEKRRIEEKMREVQRLESLGAALLESEKQILAVSEAERRRIGADLHDNVGQELTAIELLCHSVREDLRDHPLELQMGKICRFLQEAVTRTRRLARGLMPVSLDGGGLAEAIAQLVLRMSQGSVQCDFICASMVDIPDNNIADHLLHIAQEAVNNATKHARAHRVIVTLSQHREAVSLRVEDDGQGFPEFRDLGFGLGTRIMQHRAHVIGATLEIESTRGQGVKITCTLKNRA
jgi:PAS domain S-box-containing protein